MATLYINLVPTIDVFDASDGERFSNKFATLYNNEELSDVKLVVDGIEIPAHKTILAASSPYFKYIFYIKYIGKPKRMGLSC